jgi:hypothetical protein
MPQAFVCARALRAYVTRARLSGPQAHKRSGSLNNLGVGKPMHLHLLGRGNAKALGLPRDIADLTSVHAYLQFPQYYEQVRGSWGCLVGVAMGC